MRYVTLAVLGKRIRSIKKLLLDPSVPKRKKLLVIFGIIYLFVPIDLIPFTVLGFGIIDDLVLWIFILFHLADELDKYWRESEYGPREEAAVNPRKAYRGKTIIQGDGRVVEEDDAQEHHG